MGRRASLCLGLVLGARGAGRGPNGLWSVNSKLALVADSNLDGLALVDLQYGGLVERRVFDTEPNSREGAVSVSAVASCDTCASALAASEEASKLYRVYLPRPLKASLASSEDFGLELALHQRRQGHVAPRVRLLEASQHPGRRRAGERGGVERQGRRVRSFHAGGSGLDEPLHGHPLAVRDGDVQGRVVVLVDGRRELRRRVDERGDDVPRALILVDGLDLCANQPPVWDVPTKL